MPDSPPAPGGSDLPGQVAVQAPPEVGDTGRNADDEEASSDAASHPGGLVLVPLEHFTGALQASRAWRQRGGWCQG